MQCPKCHMTMFVEFDCDYIRCRNCSTLIAKVVVEEPLTDEQTEKWSPNAAMARRIKGEIAAMWDELTALRNAGVAWATIKKTMKLTFSETTLARHYNIMLAEREPAAGPSKRKQFFNVAHK